MDPRGFGHSKGTRGFIESEQIMLEDQLRFNELIDAKFNDGAPRLQLGLSLGGIMSLKMTLAKPGFFKGCGLVVPYFDLVI